MNYYNVFTLPDVNAPQPLPSYQYPKRPIQFYSSNNSEMKIPRGSYSSVVVLQNQGMESYNKAHTHSASETNFLKPVVVQPQVVSMPNIGTSPFTNQARYESKIQRPLYQSTIFSPYRQEKPQLSEREGYFSPRIMTNKIYAPQFDVSTQLRSRPQHLSLPPIHNYGQLDTKETNEVAQMSERLYLTPVSSEKAQNSPLFITKSASESKVSGRRNFVYGRRVRTYNFPSGLGLDREVEREQSLTQTKTRKSTLRGIGELSLNSANENAIESSSSPVRVKKSVRFALPQEPVTDRHEQPEYY